MAQASNTAQGSLPKHVAIIMDGNGRWATRRGLPRKAGHKRGSDTFEKIAEHAHKVGVKHLTVYALSTENIEKRPDDEIQGIYDILRSYLNDKRRHQNKQVRTIFLGDTKELPEDIQKSMATMEQSTQNNSEMILNLAVNYGGRREILQAAKALAEDYKMGTVPSLEALSEESFGATYLYTKDQPAVDMIIRTGGDMRLSNFLLWQAAYAEFVSFHQFWPDFTPALFDQALAEFAKRNRRKGGL